MKYYIDLGSSTIKIYEYEEDIVKLIEENTILFKEYFSEEGISRKNYRELMMYIKQLAIKYNLNFTNCKIYVTGIWKKISYEQYDMLKADFNEIGLKFDVITQEMENNYFEKIIQDIYSSKKFLMVNMERKSTELIVCDKGNEIIRKKLTIGIAEILNNFPKINYDNNNLKLEDILNYVLEILKDENIDFDCEYGIFTGGDIKFDKIVQYNLVPNKILNEGIHEYIITYEKLAQKNKELLENITNEDLYLFIGNNKMLMEGVKIVPILAQAIFKKANINYIIPANLNINGIIK